MNNKAKFVHWSGDNYQLTAMFNLPNGSTVSIDQVDAEGIPHEEPPEYIGWFRAIATGRRCVHCWGHHKGVDHLKLAMKENATV